MHLHIGSADVLLAFDTALHEALEVQGIGPSETVLQKSLTITPHRTCLKKVIAQYLACEMAVDGWCGGTTSHVPGTLLR